MEVSTNEVHKLLAGILVFKERTGEFGGGGDGILLLDAAHRHAKVLCLNDHRYAQGVEYLLQAVFNL